MKKMISIKIFSRCCVLSMLCSLLLLVSCSVKVPTDYREVAELPSIFPDYADVTVPVNIAPLRFKLVTPAQGGAVAVFASGNAHMVCKADEMGQFLLDESDWHALLKASAGKSLSVTIYANDGKQWLRYKDFLIHVSTDAIDDHLVYRLVQPGYVLWNKLGIYQRDLTNFDQKAIIENTRLDYNCMNCHSFNQRQPEKMVLHMRSKWGGTYIIGGDEVEKIDGKVNDRIQSLVYPYWHPSGRFIAFSSNTTRQAFHLNDANRIEVYDLASDVVIYDVAKHEVLMDSAICSSKSFETFPTFSPDGKTLYFCTANAQPMPQNFKELRYSLCAVSFDERSRKLGMRVDTLYNARIEGKSASFPRVSPDGRYLVFTAASYGTFSIWHQDADLYIIDLHTRQCRSLSTANSNSVESYHSWSGNSRWLVFSSRRMDGLYTRPFITHIDRNGHESKPFLLPQATPNFYDYFLYSYNIPELVSGEVDIDLSQTIDVAHSQGKHISVGQN